MNVVVIVALCLAGVSAQGPPPPPGGDFGGAPPPWYCEQINAEDCMDHLFDQRCGTDGVTYYNSCDLGQAYCNDTDIHQLMEGPCDPENPLTTPGSVQTNITGSADLIGSTTPAPEGLVHGSEIILDFQCVILSHTACTSTVNEVICGTDGRTYSTFCEYEKARCTHRNLHVANTGPCSD